MSRAENGAGGRVRAIVLAAGKGTRMKSARPKVLHELCGRPMLWHVVAALHAAGVTELIVVTNAELDARVPEALAASPATAEMRVRTIVQEPQRGTGHAVQIALAALARGDGPMLIAYGDMPLVPPALFAGVRDACRDGAALALVTARMPLPSSFGRIVRGDRGASGATVERIVEARDCSPDELAIDEMNAGIYAFDERALREVIGELSAQNAQGELYLTDTVALLRGRGRRVVPVESADHRDVLGVNDRVELASARAAMNARLCERYMREHGVTIVDPATTYVEPELAFGPDTIIYQNTAIGRLSEFGARCELGPNARLSALRCGERVVIKESVVVDCTLDDDVVVGPFAHLRGGSELGDGVRIGDFVELKNARLEPGVKAMHLAYLGDSTVGAGTNIGAGTITCNYDGVRKHETHIGRGVFIGSNSSLVAPLSIGDGAATGAGTVVIRDVPAGDRVVGNPARKLEPKAPAARAGTD